MNNRSIPIDTLNIVFSFFNNNGYYDLSPLRLVCREWYKETDKDKLWQQLIRPEYQSAYLESKLSAKEFYTKNIDARVDTYYCIGSPITIPRDVNGCAIPADLESLFAAFPDKENIKIFYSHEQAMECVNNLYDFQYEYYHPLFTIRINPNALKKSFFDRTVTFAFGESEMNVECFEIEASQVVNHYSVHYAYFKFDFSTIKGDESFAKTIIITNSHLKHVKAEIHKDQSCRI